MTINQLKAEVNKTIFSIGYAGDINADLYSVYEREDQGHGVWSIYTHKRGTQEVHQAMGEFKGLTLEQHKEANGIQ